MHSRLPCSFVTAKSSVLFTAPPASAWQLCLPVLYLIPPVELALKEISLPDPWAYRWSRVCPPWWLNPGGLGIFLGEPSGREPGGAGLEPTLGAFPGSRGWCLYPHPQRLHSHLAHCSPLLAATSSDFRLGLPAPGVGLGPGSTRLPRWMHSLSSSTQTSLLGTAFLGGEGIGKSWDVGSSHSHC